LVRSENFASGQFDTGFIESHLEALGATAREPDFAAAAEGIRHFLKVRSQQSQANVESAVSSPWDVRDGFQLSGAREVETPFVVDSEAVVVRIRYDETGPSVLFDEHPEAPLHGARLIEDGDTIYVIHNGRQTTVAPVDFDAQGAAENGGGVVRAPMHGKVL